MNATHALLRQHRTIRKFTDQAIEDECIEAAVQSAQHAASSSNVQAYGCLRIRDPKRRAKLAELCGGQAQVEQAPAFFIICGDQRRHRLIAEQCGRNYAANLETFLVSSIDASLFAQNLVLAFESLGLGTCYIGGLRNRLPDVDSLLELPSDVFPFYGLCVGHAAEQASHRPRLPLPAVLFDDSYPSDEDMLEQIAAYDQISADYYKQRGQPGYNWSGGTSAKFRKPTRVHLAEYYQNKGAHLR